MFFQPLSSTYSFVVTLPPRTRNLTAKGFSTSMGIATSQVCLQISGKISPSSRSYYAKFIEGGELVGIVSIKLTNTARNHEIRNA